MTDLTATIRAAGGIVHSDGNIFFKSAEQFERAAREVRPTPFCVDCGDGITAHDPGVCGNCYAMKYEVPALTPKAP